MVDILVIHLLDLKQVLLTLPALRRIKEESFQAKIHLLLNEELEKIKEFQKDFYFIDEISFMPVSFLSSSCLLRNSSLTTNLSHHSFYRGETEARPLEEKHLLENLLFRDTFPDELDLNISSIQDLDDFRRVLRKMMKKKYDQLINLTQNVFSGWMSFFLKSHYKIGLNFNSKGVVSFGSPWFRHWNENQVQHQRSVFHSCDLIYYGRKDQSLTLNSKANTSKKGISLLENTNDLKNLNKKSTTSTTKRSFEQSHIKSLNTFKDEKNLFLSQMDIQAEKEKKKENFILFHPFSKKEDSWDLENIKQNLKEIHQSFQKQISFLLIHGFGEPHPYLKRLEEKCLDNDIPVFALFEPIDHLFSIIERASFLIVRGNAFFKHLASLSQTQLVELHLDQEDKEEEEAYKKDTLLVQSHKDHFIFPKALSVILKSLFSPEKSFLYEPSLMPLLKNLAHDFEKEVSLHLTEITNLEFCVRRPVKVRSVTDAKTQESHESSQSLKFIRESLERLSWKLLFEREHLKEIGSYGTESLKLRSLIQDLYTIESMKECSLLFSQMEDEIRNKNEAFQSLNPLWLEALCGGDESKVSHFLKEWSHVRDSSSDFLSSFSSSPSSLAHKLRENNLFFLRKVQTAVDDVSEKNHIKLKLLRSVNESLFASSD